MSWCSVFDKVIEWGAGMPVQLKRSHQAVSACMPLTSGFHTQNMERMFHLVTALCFGLVFCLPQSHTAKEETRVALPAVLPLAFARGF